MTAPEFIAPEKCCSCLGQPSQQIRITSRLGAKGWGRKKISGYKRFHLPICARCAKRIRLKKVIPQLLFFAFIGLGLLFPEGSRNRDMFTGLGIAFEIAFVVGLIHNFLDPASWWHGRYLFKKKEYYRLFREANPAVPAAAYQLFPYEKISE